MAEHRTRVTGSEKGGLLPRIAVVICTHHRPSSLERCLQQLGQADYAEFSVIVVDSAPRSPEAREIAARHGARYEVVPLKGLSRARNVGSRAAQADVIAFLDDDMVPHSRWLRSLLEGFADKDVAAVTGPVLALDLADSTDADLARSVSLGTLPFQIDRSSPLWFERVNFGGIGNGNFALRRDAFIQIQGFDERLGRGATIDAGEENYAFFKVVDSGYKIAYAPQAVVFHPRSPMNHESLRKVMAEAVAYFAFLAFNHPSQSLRVIKFSIGGALGWRGWWRPSPGRGYASLSIYDQLRSGLAGLSAFLRSVFR